MILSPLPGRLFRITQRFYDRPEYYTKYGLKAHGGIDLSPPIPGMKGMTVYAPHEGYITTNDFGSKGFGKHIYITSEPYDREGTRRQTVLAHFDSFLVHGGQFVAAGDPVGIMGTTGDSTNVHCHFGYRRVDEDGNVLEPKNGFNGFIDVSPYVHYWTLSTLG